MEEISDSHLSALKWLAKADYDLSRAIQSMLDRRYQDAHGEASRVRESIRQLLEVDQDLTDKDQNEES